MQWKLKKPMRILIAEAIISFLETKGITIPKDDAKGLPVAFEDNTYEYNRRIYFHCNDVMYIISVTSEAQNLKTRVTVEQTTDDFLEEVRERNIQWTNELQDWLYEATNGVVGLCERYHQAIRQAEQEMKGSDVEQLLNRHFPNARSRQIVEFEGKKYRMRYWPAADYGWNSAWEPCL